MGFSEPFIARPVATILLSIGLLLAGVVAYRFLPISALPSVDIPTIVVIAARPGADPETMANSVAAPSSASICRGMTADRKSQKSRLATFRPLPGMAK